MWELFHEVAQRESAQARKYVTAYQLEARVRFRNIVYPEVKRDFDARGGASLPALWDGTALVQGIDAVLARLAQLR